LRILKASISSSTMSIIFSFLAWPLIGTSGQYIGYLEEKLSLRAMHIDYIPTLRYTYHREYRRICSHRPLLS
jgi:hypothetical protein